MSFLVKRDLSSIRNKAASLVSSLESDLNDGTIRTVDELRAAISKAYNNFFLDINKPSIQPLPMEKYSLLIRQYITEPMLESFDDIQIANNKLSSLRQTTLFRYNLSSSEIIGLKNLLASTKSFMDTYSLTANDSDPDYLWIYDTFRTNSFTDLSNTTCNVNVDNGFISLPIIGTENLNQFIDHISIDKGASFGIPGNNIEIKSQSSSGSNTSPNVVLVRSGGDNSDITQLFDNNNSTWFEWEANYIRENQPVKVQGDSLVKDIQGDETNVYSATNYQTWMANVTWPGESSSDNNNGAGYPIATLISSGITAQTSVKYSIEGIVQNPPCSLGLNIFFTQPIDISWIEITPYSKEYTSPILKSAYLSNDSNSWKQFLSKSVVLSDIQTLSNNNLTAKTGVISIPIEESISAVKLLFSQPLSYIPNTGLAHPYFVKHIKKVTTKKILFIKKTKTEYISERVGNGNMEVGTASTKQSGLGSTLSNISNSLLGGTLGNVVGDILGGLFGSKKVVTTVLDVQSGFDIFDGERAFIGLRDISFTTNTFLNTGVFQSQPWVFNKPISKVSLVVNDSIPSNWDNSKEWIKYEISTDSSNWIQIIPDTNISIGSTSSFIDIAPTTTILLRITLTSPGGNNNQSPIVNNYALKCI